MPDPPPLHTNGIWNALWSAAPILSNAISIPVQDIPGGASPAARKILQRDKNRFLKQYDRAKFELRGRSPAWPPRRGRTPRLRVGFAVIRRGSSVASSRRFHVRTYGCQ